MRKLSSCKCNSIGKVRMIMDHKNKDHAERTEDVLFCIIVAGIIIFVGGLGILHVLDLEWIAQGAPCFIYSLTGWYCPGCGGTRAVKALLCGRLFDSIYLSSGSTISCRMDNYIFVLAKSSLSVKRTY